ncbi:MAG: class I SAM-dependent methyltransferase [Lachnospiraceae bacterium]|nr:class I SAM-dependent methyltransferase [Lachnospiraceae bacterium]
MNQKDIIEFFDRCAPNWDARMIINDAIVTEILENANVKSYNNILDVACGTGVMIPYYLMRGAVHVDAIDISPCMANIARSKFPRNDVNIICGDVEKLEITPKYDNIIIYNAFPHFPEPERLIEHLSAMLTPSGTLTVAHGMSREKIDALHKGGASRVSMGLLSARELASIFGKYLHVTTIISDSRMYQVVGIKEV